MTYERKIDIMVAAFCTVQGDQGEVWEAGIRKSLLDGFLRIRKLEMAEGAAEARCCFFPVERIQEGFGIWNRGGYDSRRGFGQSVAAAGMDGEKLRQIRYVAERNGRHSLAVVYPGCYLAVCISRDMHDPNSIAVYRVEGFQETESGVYQARAAKVYQMDPYYSSLSEAQEKCLDRLIRVSVWIATTPDLYRLRDKV